jgi:hypothetical protein
MVTSFNRGRRNAMIRELVDNDINMIIHDANEYGDTTVLAEILENGFKGYENMFDDQLIQEMNERGLWDNWFEEQA